MEIRKYVRVASMDFSLRLDEQTRVGDQNFVVMCLKYDGGEGVPRYFYMTREVADQCSSDLSDTLKKLDKIEKIKD